MSATAYSRLVDALRARGGTVNDKGGAAIAQCPAHDDRTPSLSVRQIEGQALIHCYAGCATPDVMSALGLGMADLFDDARGATYRYDDGRVVHRSPDKRFRQTGNTAGRPQLYRLAQVRAAVAACRPVYLVEGEKDADALASLDVAATTAPMGASNFAKVDVSPLAGAHVVVVPDQDEPGQRWLTDVLSALRTVAKSVQVAAPATGKDAADHVAAGHGIDDLTPVEQHAPRRLKVTVASDVECRRVRYLWQHYVPLGAVTLLPGEEGIGKSTVGARLMADLTRGTLPGEHHGHPRSVMVIAPEDGIADVFTPRLREAGADLTRVHFVQATILGPGGEQAVVIPHDLDLIAEEAARNDVALVWVDSLVTTLPEGMKSTEYKATATVLKRLGEFADAGNLAVIAPWHLNKSAGSDTANRIMDSRAFRTAVRSMLLVVADPDAPPDGPRVGLIGLDKANAGTLDVPVLRYRIREATFSVREVDRVTGEVTFAPGSCGVADWSGEYEGGLAGLRAALAPGMERENDPRSWLAQFLAESGPTGREQVVQAGGAAGHSEKSLSRAAGRLRVRYVPHVVERPGKPPLRTTVWRLPEEDSPRSGHVLPTVPTVPTDALGRVCVSSSSQVEGGEDGEDGQDGQAKDMSGVQTTHPGVLTGQTGHAPGRSSAPCITCGQPILLLKPGKVACERCAPTITGYSGNSKAAAS